MAVLEILQRLLSLIGWFDYHRLRSVDYQRLSEDIFFYLLPWTLYLSPPFLYLSVCSIWYPSIQHSVMLRFGYLDEQSLISYKNKYQLSMSRMPKFVIWRMIPLFPVCWTPFFIYLLYSPYVLSLYTMSKLSLFFSCCIYDKRVYAPRWRRPLELCTPAVIDLVVMFLSINSMEIGGTIWGASLPLIKKKRESTFVWINYSISHKT